MNIRQSVIQILSEVTLIDNDIEKMNDNENLLNHGLDSYQLTKAIVALEKKLNILFDDEELIAYNFNTLHNIIEAVQGKLHEQG